MTAPTAKAGAWLSRSSAFDASTRRWAAYWADRRQCWQEYDVRSTDDLAVLLAAFGEDLEVFGW